MCPPTEETKTEKSEQFIKLAENDFVLVLAIADKKQFDSYLIEDTRENNFIRKIIAASTLNPENKHPGFEVGREIEVSPLIGIKHILHAKLQAKHRILLIMRHVHISQLDKLVVLFLQDDPNHKVNLKGIRQSYQQKGYDCGSDIHWSNIIIAINNRFFLEVPASSGRCKAVKPILKQVLVLENKGEPTSTTTIATLEQQTEAFTDQSHVEIEEPDKQNQTEPPEPSLNLRDDEEKRSQVAPALTPSLSQMEEAASERLETLKVSKKNKKKKKTFADSIVIEDPTGIYSKYANTKDFLSVIEKTLLNANGIEVLQTLLDCGMNPDLCDENGMPFLKMAFLSKSVEAVRLLLDRGASLTSHEEGEPSSLLALFILWPSICHLSTSNREILCNESESTYRAILKLLIQKSKDEGALNQMIPPLNIYTALFVAATTPNFVAVEELLKAGASPTVRCQRLTPQGQALSGSTPAEAAKTEFTRKRLFHQRLSIQDERKFQSVLKLLQLEEKTEVLALLQTTISTIQKKVDKKDRAGDPSYLPKIFQPTPNTKRTLVKDSTAEELAKGTQSFS